MIINNKSGIINIAGNSIQVDVTNGYLVNSGGTVSLDWASGTLLDSYSYNSLSWESRAMYDPGSSLSVDWGARYLYANDGSTVVLDYNYTTGLYCEIAFSPSLSSGGWATSDPTTLREAIDRVAYQIWFLGGQQIP